MGILLEGGGGNILKRKSERKSSHLSPAVSKRLLAPRTK